MLLKLIKHEMRASGRIMLPLLALLPVIGALSALSLMASYETNAVILEVIHSLTNLAYVVGCAAVVGMAFVVMIMRFRRSMLSDEGYLTNTLPTSVHALVCSRLITALIYYLLAIVSLVLSAFLYALITGSFAIEGGSVTFGGFSDLPYFFGFDMEGLDLGRLGLQALWTSVLGIISSCLTIYAALAIGHSFANRKSLLSVVFFIILSIAESTVNSILRFNKALVLSGIPTGAEISGWLSSQLLDMALSTIVFGAICYVITVLMLRRKLNLA